MARPVLITPPAVAPVTLAEFKAHIREDSSDQDDTLQIYLDAAVAHLDGYSGVLSRCLINQTWRASYAKWRRVLCLPFPDVSAVTVQYYDSDGSQQTVASSLYEITEETDGSAIRFLDAFTSPSLDSDRVHPVTVDLTAGYGATAADVPDDLRHAIYLLAAHWEQNRVTVGDTQAELPLAFSALTAKYRRVGV
jgi:uncharacterized phiE125 gp8 family phage protein